MLHTPLPEEKVDCIRDYCRKTLEHICNKIQSIPPNLVNFSNNSKSMMLNNNNKNGLLGYMLPHTNQNSNSTHSRQLTDNERLAQLKLSFFSNFEIRHKAAVKRLLFGRKIIVNKVKNKCFNFDYIETNADIAIRNMFGLCDELSMIAIKLLIKNVIINIDIRISLFRGFNFFHRFVVFGLPDDCDPYNFMTWPNNVVILDPWLHCYFLLKDMPYYWRDMGYADNWADMQSWDGILDIMKEKVLIDEHHIFFERFKPMLEMDFYLLNEADLVDLDQEHKEPTSSCTIS